MIELTIKIDCEKTEKALNAFCKASGQTVDETLKEWLDINGTLIALATTLKENPTTGSKFLLTAGKDAFFDLMGILE